MKSFYFIRHGQSLANTGAKSMPDSDIPLTALGEQQAQQLLEKWQQLNINPSKIYHSPLLRAKQTAMIFNQGTGLDITELAELKEFCCLSLDNIRDMVGAERRILADNYWQTASIDSKDGIDADSFAEFQSRVTDFLAKAESFPDKSLFFGHGIWIGMLAWQLLGLTAENNADIQKFRQFQTALPMYNTVVYQLNIIDNIRHLQMMKLS